MKTKKFLYSIMLLVFASLLLFASACNSQKGGKPETGEKKTTSSVYKVQEVSITPTAGPVLTKEEQIHKDMVDRSLLAAGNNYRIKKVIEKAKKGEDVTLAFIGGSITEGYNAGTKNNFAKLTKDYFAETYSSKDKVHLVNAGLSGTPSTLGLIRSDRDIFAYHPDIIFIEFAVNDGQSGTDPTAFKSLVAKALKQDNSPAVVLLFSVVKSGYTCQSQMALTGFNYKLPMISITNALQPEFDAGRMTWEDWSNDEAHPNEFGHKLYSEFIINYLKKADSADIDKPAQIPERFIRMFDYTGMKMFDKTNTKVIDLGSFHEEAAHQAFQNGWAKSQGSSKNKAIRFKIKAKSFFVIYKEMNSETFGTADVYVDNKQTTNLPGNAPEGWGNPKTAIVFDNKESVEHTIEIKMAAGDEDKAFAILGFGVCQ